MGLGSSEGVGMMTIKPEDFEDFEAFAAAALAVDGIKEEYAVNAWAHYVAERSFADAPVSAPRDDYSGLDFG